MAERRRRLEREAIELDPLTRAKALVELASLYKQEGTGDERHAFVAAYEAAVAAIALLRDLDEPELLADALRASAVPFVAPNGGLEALQESLEIMRRLGDNARIGWALYHLEHRSIHRGKRGEGVPFREPEAIFRQCGCREGLAAIAFSRTTLTDGLERTEAFRTAAGLYEELGETRRAYMTLVAWECLDSELDLEQRYEVLRRALRLGNEHEDARGRANLLRRLEENAEALAACYRARHDEIEVEAYGSKDARKLADLAWRIGRLEGQVDASRGSPQRERRESLREELKRLKV